MEHMVGSPNINVEQSGKVENISEMADGMPITSKVLM